MFETSGAVKEGAFVFFIFRRAVGGARGADDERFGEEMLFFVMYGYLFHGSLSKLTSCIITSIFSISKFNCMLIQLFFLFNL